MTPILTFLAGLARIVRRVRWYLARRVAPEPIMRDPFPGEDGVFVYGVTGGYVWAMRTARFRLKSTHRLNVREYRSGQPFEYRPSKAFTRFVGTVGE